MRTLTIDGHLIADGEEPFVVAEIGHNHGGSLDKALNMIWHAKVAGASAVKFQTRVPVDVYQANSKRGAYFFTSDNPQWMDLVYGKHREKLEFSRSQWIDLKTYCVTEGITFISTPFDFKSADLLAELNVSCYKIASGDATNIPLIKHVAKNGKPVIVSTGGCTLDDVRRVYDSVEHGQLALLQCSCVYPAPPEALNLRVIETYRSEFPDVVIGLSTHSPEWQTSVAAYVLGARIFEHHFTIDREWKGTDNRFSLTPPTMSDFIEALAITKKALGSSHKFPSKIEKEPTLERRKSLVWARQVLEWGEITREDIKIQCPGDGIAPYYLDLIIGKKVAHTTGVNELVAWHDLLIEEKESSQFDAAVAKA